MTRVGTFVANSTDLLELVKRFIESLDVSQSSRATYYRELKQFIGWLKETDRITALYTLHRLDILAYREHLLTIGKSSYTVDGYMTAVRKLFEWLESEKVYPNIAKGVKGTKKAKGFQKGLSYSLLRSGRPWNQSTGGPSKVSGIMPFSISLSGPALEP